MIESNRLSQKLQELRKREGFSQSKLADLVGVSFMTIRRWESGEVIPRLDEIKRLADVLHITVDELLNDSNNDKVELVISWNWEDMKKGEMNMADNNFKIVLGEEGQVGVTGMARLTSFESINEFVERFRKQLIVAYKAQIERGVIQPAIQEA